MEVRLGYDICTLPAMTSVVACAEPLYGTCTMFMPAIELSSAPARFPGEPLPDEEKLSFPGCARASAIRPFRLDTGRLGCVTSTTGVEPTSPIGEKSRTLS